MLFSGKENVFMCLAATKFVLWKINSGVWFIQTFLQKMLYMPNFPYTSLTVNMQIMNQFHTQSQKKQNSIKKFIKSGQIEIAQRRRRWDCAVKVRSVRSSDERRDRRAVRSSDERARRSRRLSNDRTDLAFTTRSPLLLRRAISIWPNLMNFFIEFCFFCEWVWNWFIICMFTVEEVCGKLGM